MNVIMMRTSISVDDSLRLGDCPAEFVAVKRNIMRSEGCYVTVLIWIYETYDMVVSLLNMFKICLPKAVLDLHVSNSNTR